MATRAGQLAPRGCAEGISAEAETEEQQGAVEEMHARIPYSQGSPQGDFRIGGAAQKETDARPDWPNFLGEAGFLQRLSDTRRKLGDRAADRKV